MNDNRALSAELMQEYAEHSPFTGTITAPSFLVEGGNPACGDQIELAVQLRGDQLESARFVARGCLISRAAAGLMAELVTGKPIAHVLELALPALESGLGTDFRSRVKCALLPLYILQEGLKQFSRAPVEGARFHVSAPRNLGM